MTGSMSSFQKYIVCGVFYTPCGWYIPKYVPKWPETQNGSFGAYLGTYHPYSIYNTPQTIYFWKLLIETVILSYKTLKSNNFEKMTYNANLEFSKWFGGGPKFNFWAPNFFSWFLGLWTMGKCVIIWKFPERCISGTHYYSGRDIWDHILSGVRHLDFLHKKILDPFLHTVLSIDPLSWLFMKLNSFWN